MNFEQFELGTDQLKDLYRHMLYPRLVEEKMLVLLRQGRISKWFSGIGQEAISVGCTLALHQDEYILPLHRNLGVFTSRKMPFGKLFAQWQGRYEGFSKGRERSFHFGSNEFHIVGMISHLGPQLAVANGIALADKIDGNQKVTLVFSGDGGTSEGDFHESLNVAAVWQLPVIFVIENNGYGLSTPSNEQFRCKQFIDKGIGYGMRAVQIDGNNILEVYETVRKLAEELRENPEPILLECITFRMRGHEEASGTKYVPQELIEKWAQKDPLNNYQQYLLDNGVISSKEIEEITLNIKAEIQSGLDYAFDLQAIVPNDESELNDLYAPFDNVPVLPSSNGKRSSKRLIDAVSDGLRQSMEKHENFVLMGQDIAEYGGVFKITQGFVEQFGKDRVRNTPLCESAIIGAGLGLSIKHKKAMVEMQFADFVTSGFNPIVNNLAKIHYRWGQNADVIIRMPTGAGVGAGPFHSQSNEAWFFHVPGLKIVYPSNPYDAKGLLCAAINDPNPYLFFEHKFLYRSIQEEIPDEYYALEIGKAKIVIPGDEVTVVAYGLSVHWALEYKKLHPQVNLELVDLRTLMPWDKETVLNSVKKTGRAIIVHEDTLTGGIGAEIAAFLSEFAFQHLDAPIVRHGAMDTPVPFDMGLEANFLGKEKFFSKLNKLIMF